jgi:hypothetical protein
MIELIIMILRKNLGGNVMSYFKVLAKISLKITEECHSNLALDILRSNIQRLIVNLQSRQTWEVKHV